jgi:hypothetical protein
MTMDANRKLNEDGQSILEFLLTLPMLLGFVILLIKINTAIQISIVDQQYARAQALFITYNSPFYPEISKYGRLISNSTHQLILGVSDNAASGDSYQPIATEQLITRSKKNTASNAPREEPKLRANVRVRNSVTLCTPNIFLMGQGGAALPLVPLSNSAPVIATGPSPLGESSRFNYICGSQMKYEQ